LLLPLPLPLPLPLRFACPQLCFDCSRATGSSVCLGAEIDIVLLPEQRALLDPGQIALTEVWHDD